VLAFSLEVTWELTFPEEFFFSAKFQIGTGALGAAKKPCKRSRPSEGQGTEKKTLEKRVSGQPSDWCPALESLRLELALQVMWPTV